MTTAQSPRPTREKILDAATALFYSRGVHTVGVDEIVEKSGVAKMTLYKHFASKSDLASAYLERSDERWSERFFEDVKQRAPGPAGRLLAVFDVLGDWFATPGFRGCALLNFVLENGDGSDAGRDICRRHKQAVLGFLVDLARSARVERPLELAEQLLLLMDGAIVSAVMWNSALPAQRARQIASALLDR